MPKRLFFNQFFMSQPRNQQQRVRVSFAKHILQVHYFPFFFPPNTTSGSYSFRLEKVKNNPTQAMKVNVDVEVSLRSFLTSARHMIELT